MCGRATITLGIGPHSSLTIFSIIEQYRFKVLDFLESIRLECCSRCFQSC